MRQRQPAALARARQAGMGLIGLILSAAVIACGLYGLYKTWVIAGVYQDHRTIVVTIEDYRLEPGPVNAAVVERRLHERLAREGVAEAVRRGIQVRLPRRGPSPTPTTSCAATWWAISTPP